MAENSVSASKCSAIAAWRSASSSTMSTGRLSIIPLVPVSRVSLSPDRGGWAIASYTDPAATYRAKRWCPRATVCDRSRHYCQLRSCYSSAPCDVIAGACITRNGAIREGGAAGSTIGLAPGSPGGQEVARGTGCCGSSVAEDPLGKVAGSHRIPIESSNIYADRGSACLAEPAVGTIPHTRRIASS